MPSTERRSRGYLVLLSMVLSAASCTAILGIGGDFKQAGAGGSAGASTSSSSHGGGPSSTGSQSSSSHGSGGAGGSTATSTGGAGGSGGNDAACLSCIASNCATELATCTNDTMAGCAAWYTCLGTCHDSAEATTCDQSHESAKSDYTAIYMCAASMCPSACAELDPAAHPCQIEQIYGTDGGIFCPFADPDGGAVFCTQSGQHCCQQAALDGGAQCQGSANDCMPPSDYDWRCAGPGNCSMGANDICCTSGPGNITFDDSPQCETKVGNSINGTVCQTSCNAAQGQYQVCTNNADCTAPQKCWAVAAHGFKIAVCH